MRLPGFFHGGIWDAVMCLLALEALAHEFFALVAFLVLRIQVALLHAFLLSRFLVAGRFSGFAAQAVAHELLALVALLVFGVLIALLHALLLGRPLVGRFGVFGAQAVAHELLALITLAVSGVLVADRHLALLGGRCLLVVGGMGSAKGQGQADGQCCHQFFHAVFPLEWVGFG